MTISCECHSNRGGDTQNLVSYRSVTLEDQLKIVIRKPVNKRQPLDNGQSTGEETSDSLSTTGVDVGPGCSVNVTITLTPK